MDAAASADNALLPRRRTRTTTASIAHGLRSASGATRSTRRFQNGSIGADTEVRAGGCPLAVLLLPADRTEQPWWHDFCGFLRPRGKDHHLLPLPASAWRPGCCRHIPTLTRDSRTGRRAAATVTRQFACVPDIYNLRLRAMSALIRPDSRDQFEAPSASPEARRRRSRSSYRASRALKRAWAGGRAG